MIKEGKRIVLKASEGITFRVQEGTDEIVIRAVVENVFSNSSDNYKTPIIPEGYVHLEGTWDTGFVIQNKADKSEFVWIPVGFLDQDGTHDGVNFDQKFGRKNFYNPAFFGEDYHEEINLNLIKSVKKYGGFYFSRYHASKTNLGKPVFKKSKIPWCNINYYDAKAAAAGYANKSSDVISCLTTGTAFDSVLGWIIKSGAKTYEEVVEDSTSWGNYFNTQNSSRDVMPTGSNEGWCACNIYDVAGNVCEWASEAKVNLRHAIRGGSYVNVGMSCPAALREYHLSTCYCEYISFRAMLYLK